MMSTTPFPNGMNFDQETTRVMGVAIEMVCATLRTGDCDDDVKEAIAEKVIALAKAGERNPDKLREEALKDICRPNNGPPQKLRGLRYDSRGSCPVGVTAITSRRIATRSLRRKIVRSPSRAGGQRTRLQPTGSGRILSPGETPKDADACSSLLQMRLLVGVTLATKLWYGLKASLARPA
jgi:hypothetical protein